jgi:hypothetical protein
VAGRDIATDNRGNSYVTGSFFQTAIFGAGEDNETVLSASGDEIFLAKYDPNGVFLWARKGAGGSGIPTDSSGNSYVTGSFSAQTAAKGNYLRP